MGPLCQREGCMTTHRLGHAAVKLHRPAVVTAGLSPRSTKS